MGKIQFNNQAQIKMVLTFYLFKILFIFRESGWEGKEKDRERNISVQEIL